MTRAPSSLAAAAVLAAALAWAHDDGGDHGHGEGTMTHDHGVDGPHAHHAGICLDESASPSTPDPCQCGWDGDPDAPGRNHRHPTWPLTAEELANCNACGRPEGCPADDPEEEGDDTMSHHGHTHRAGECWDESTVPATPDECQCGWDANPDEPGAQHRHGGWPETRPASCSTDPGDGGDEGGDEGGPPDEDDESWYRRCPNGSRVFAWETCPDAEDADAPVVHEDGIPTAILRPAWRTGT